LPGDPRGGEEDVEVLHSAADQGGQADDEEPDTPRRAAGGNDQTARADACRLPQRARTKRIDRFQLKHRHQPHPGSPGHRRACDSNGDQFQP